MFFSDKSLTKALLIPFESDDVNRVPQGDSRDKTRSRPLDGFRCYILENSLPDKTIFTASNKRGRDQMEAESEYNKLRRGIFSPFSPYCLYLTPNI